MYLSTKTQEMSKKILNGNSVEFTLVNRNYFDEEQYAGFSYLTLDNFLSCYKNDLDGRISLEYDFGNKIAVNDYLQMLISTNRISSAIVKEHFQSLFALLLKLYEYPVLSIDNVCLSMEEVYIDIETNKVFFLYFPINLTSDLSTDINQLIDQYLMLLADDNGSVLFLHKLKMELKKSNLNFSRILDFIRLYQPMSFAASTPNVNTPPQQQVVQAQVPPTVAPAPSVQKVVPVQSSQNSPATNQNQAQQVEAEPQKKKLFSKQKKAEKPKKEKKTKPAKVEENSLGNSGVMAMVKNNLVLSLIFQVLIVLLVIAALKNGICVDEEQNFDIVKFLAIAVLGFSIGEYLLYKILLKRSGAEAPKAKTEKVKKAKNDKKPKQSRFNRQKSAKTDKKQKTSRFAKKEMPSVPAVNVQAEKPLPQQQVFNDRQYAVIDEGTYLIDEQLENKQDSGTELLEQNTTPNSPRLMMVSNGQLINLSNNVNVIGRNPNLCSVCLASNSVSNVHAMISFADNGVYIKDNNSKNGTFINGQKLNANQSYALHGGEQITFADVRVEYKC